MINQFSPTLVRVAENPIYDEVMAGRPTVLWVQYVPASFVQLRKRIGDLGIEIHNRRTDAGRQRDTREQYLTKHGTWLKRGMEEARDQQAKRANELGDLQTLLEGARRDLELMLWDLLRENEPYKQALRTQIQANPDGLHYEDLPFARNFGLI